MINFKTVIRIIGILLLLETVMLLLCSGVSFYYQDEALVDFWVSAGITAGAGLLLAAMGKGGDRQLTRRDGYVLVSFAWVAFSLFGMLPFYISGYIPSITNAFFETMSGFSSTGATILDDIEALPHGLLFWRSMTQWIGGLGIIMFTIAILPIFGVSGLQVFAAEASNKISSKHLLTAKHRISDNNGDGEHDYNRNKPPYPLCHAAPKIKQIRSGASMCIPIFYLPVLLKSGHRFKEGVGNAGYISTDVER